MAGDKVNLKVSTKNKMRFKKNVPVSKPPQQQHRERYTLDKDPKNINFSEKESNSPLP